MIPVIISFPVHISIISHSDNYLEIGNDLLKEGIANGSALPLDRQCVHDEDESLYPSNDLVVAVSINLCSFAVSTDDLFPIHRPQAVVVFVALQDALEPVHLIISYHPLINHVLIDEPPLVVSLRPLGLFQISTFLTYFDRNFDQKRFT